MVDRPSEGIPQPPETGQAFPSDTPASPIADGQPAVGARPQRGIAAYLVVGVLAAAIGAAVMFVGLRYTSSLSRMVGSAASQQQQQPTMPGQAPSAKAQPMPGMEMPEATAAARPPGTSDKAVQISPERQQLIGVRTATIEPRALETTIRTVGVLAYDETRVTEIHTKIAGWVDRLFVDYIGKNVKRGESLFTIYSPDLVATQNEYLLARRGADQMQSSEFAAARTGTASLVAAARERLKLWDISDAQIAELERSGEPRKTLTLYSPFSGVVLERNTFAGQYVTPEMSTFKIADLSRIWVLGQVFEYELGRIRLGQQAEVQFPYGQVARPLQGRVTFIAPQIDPETRRAQVRIEFPNPGLEFKPQTYVTVVLKTPGGAQLAVPKEAVIDDGRRQYAILALPGGYFDPRVIQVGQPDDQYYPLVSGLAAGDRVVTSAQFLIDSETNLQSAMQAMSATMPGMSGGGTKEPAAPVAPKDDSMKGMPMPPTPKPPERE